MLGGIEKACDSALAALAAGDGKALEVLYDRMGRAILSVAYAVTETCTTLRMCCPTRWSTQRSARRATAAAPARVRGC